MLAYRSGHVMQYYPRWSRLAMLPLAKQQGRSVAVLSARDSASKGAEKEGQKAARPAASFARSAVLVARRDEREGAVGTRRVK